MNIFERFFEWFLKWIFGIKEEKQEPIVSTPIPDPIVEPEPEPSNDEFYPPRAFKTYKFALLVGVNKYAMPGADLNGCVNDVHGMKGVLTKYYGFDPNNMMVLLDKDATRENIINGLNWLVARSREGAELVFHYSGHGSQVLDKDGDEVKDQLDEILCPHDLDWNHPLTDDIIHNKFKQIHPGAFLTMVCDSCHSGTMSREMKPPGVGCSCGDGCGCKTKSRYLQPPQEIIDRQIKAFDLGKIKAGPNKIGKKQGKGIQNHVLLSGCKDNQTSADAYINNKYQGALTANLLRALTLSPRANWPTIHRKAVSTLKGAGFAQDPQLSGADDLLNRNVFGG